jgi:hypothetical protein
LSAKSGTQQHYAGAGIATELLVERQHFSAATDCFIGVIAL